MIVVLINFTVVITPLFKDQHILLCSMYFKLLAQFENGDLIQDVMESKALVHMILEGPPKWGQDVI